MARKPELLTVSQASVALKCSRQRLLIWIKEKRVFAHRYGDSWLIPKVSCKRPDPLPPGRPKKERLRKRRRKAGASH